MRYICRAFLIAAIALVVRPPAVTADPPEPTSAGIEFFEKKVRPVLVEQCYSCHSGQAKSPRGGLRLDSRAAVLKGGDTGPAVVPGKPAESLLVKAVRQTDPGLSMPPKG